MDFWQKKDRSYKKVGLPSFFWEQKLTGKILWYSLKKLQGPKHPEKLKSKKSLRTGKEIGKGKPY